jgi:hypothetical protein
LLTVCLAAAAPAQQIVVVEGEGAQSAIEKPVAPPLVVELRDASGAPIPRAEVTFRSPTDGPSATFFGAAHVSKSWTDEQGRAHAADLTPNRIAGPYTITVEAQGATAQVQRTNVAPEMVQQRKKRRFGPKVWVPIVVGAVIVIIGLAQRD